MFLGHFSNANLYAISMKKIFQMVYKKRPMSLHEILEIQESRKRKEIALYESIYKLVQSKINRQVSLNSVACLFQIPKVKYGFPLINVPKTMEYILKILNEKGFIAFPVSHDTIYISWEMSNVLKKQIKKEENTKKEIIQQEEEKRDDELARLFLRTKLKKGP
jgi:hypothetical protein